MLKNILIVEAIGKPDKRRHHRFVSFASVRLNGIVCFAKGKMHCFATLDKAELRRSIKRRQTASVFPVVVERHNTTQNEKGEKMKTTLSYEIIPETGKVSSSLGGRMRIKHNHLANAHGFGAFNPYNETCEHEKNLKKSFSNSK